MIRENRVCFRWRLLALTQDDRDFIAYFRSVFKRYNIVPSKATELEYEFVTKVAESEFYEKRAQA